VTAAKWGRNPAPPMKIVVLQELASAMFHVEHKKNRVIRLSSPADSFSLFAIFAVLGLLRAGFRRRLLSLFIGVGHEPNTDDRTVSIWLATASLCRGRLR
jgi:hypothetical protein